MAIQLWGKMTKFFSTLVLCFVEGGSGRGWGSWSDCETQDRHQGKSGVVYFIPVMIYRFQNPCAIYFTPRSRKLCPPGLPFSSLCSRDLMNAWCFWFPTLQTSLLSSGGDGATSTVRLVELCHCAACLSCSLLSLCALGSLIPQYAGLRKIRSVPLYTFGVCQWFTSTLVLGNMCNSAHADTHADILF